MLDLFVNSLYNFSYISFGFSILYGSVFFISKFVYEPLIISDNEIPFEDMYPFDNFEYWYLDEYNNLEDIQLDSTQKSNLSKQFISVETPRGLVHITYHQDVNAFLYYAKTKDIPYKYLETVGRKFVIDNNCKNIFIN